VVVDSGSTDSTLEIVEAFSDARIIQLEPGLGIAKALNAGIAAAHGTFIARLDADDIAYEWRIHDQVLYLLAHPEVDLIGTGVDSFGDHEGFYRAPLEHKNIRDEFLVNNPFFHPTVMFRRRLVDRNLLRYNEEFFTEEDYELWGRLIPVITCANLDQSSIRYRIRGTSNQWDPRKFRYKRKALEGFCQLTGVVDDALIDALAEFQCGAFIRYHSYTAMRDYAMSAIDRKLPKMGWIHEALVREPGYPEFTRWYRRARGWSA
jgi:glycosyltransferase involved in cell wall biosynthesis